MKPRHFLSLFDFSRDELQQLIERSIELKAMQRNRQDHSTCAGRVLAMIFELSSTRTRIAFETGMYQLGGSAVFLNPTDTQLGRGEPTEDTARVLSRVVDIVMIRARDHATLTRFAEYSDIPVINAMTNQLHPCQLLADMMTWIESRGSISGKRVAFIGDGYNMCNSYIEASVQFDFELRIATPPQFAPTHIPSSATSHVESFTSATEAVAGADLVATDVWSSMGQDRSSEIKQLFEGFQVTSDLLDRASPDCMFLHCLPAHRGEEVDEHVLDDPRSAVWEEAENRLHSQKALIEVLLRSES